MDWISELALKRRAQRTNVFIMETFDMRRIEEFKEATKEGNFSKLAKTEYTNIFDFNLQRNELTNLKNDQKLGGDPMFDPLKEIDNSFLGSKTIAIIHYVFSSQHADRLADYLAAWSQDVTIHTNKSTAVVYVSDAMLFPESLRRLCYQILIPPSTAEERKALLERDAEELSKGFEEMYKQKLKLTVSEDVIQASSGLDLHSTETAAYESFFTERKFTVKAFTDLKIKILNTYNLEYIQPQIDFSLVGGYNSLKNYIQNRVITPLRNPEKAQRYGVGLPRGIILYGYPGTGKTHISKALAKQLGLAMVKLTPADLFRGIVGESESRVKQITTLIESLAPVVVMIDEVDQIATPRDQVMMTDSGVSRRITNMLLDWLGQSERKSLLVGCTNFMPLDPAFLRAGRVDEICLVLPPDREARKEILLIHCNKLRQIPMVDKEKDAILSDVANKTFMWTGAELEKLVLDAARLAMEQDAKHVTAEHFDEGIKSREINERERSEGIQRMISTMKKLENVNKAFLREAVKEFQKGEKDESRVKALLESL